MKKVIEMKKVLIAVAGVIGVWTFTSCEKVVGEGPVVLETRNVTDFRSVSVSVSGKVNYKIDPVYKVEIQAQQNILDILQTKKVGNELVIKIQDGKRVRSHEDILVTISAPFADAVNLSGTAEFNLVNTLAAPNLDLRISGSGNINIVNVDLTDQLTANISGSGSINLNSGNIKNAHLKISGSGNINAGNVAGENAVAVISGSGNIQTRVSQTLDATISGSGSVYYRGNPVISAHISGSGKVKPF